MLEEIEPSEHKSFRLTPGSDGPDSSVVVGSFRSALVFSLVLQLPLLFLAALILDGGQIFKRFAIASVAIWILVLIFGIRRGSRMTDTDILFVKWGYLPILLITCIMWFVGSAIYSMRNVIYLLVSFGFLVSCCGCMPGFPDTSATPEQAYASLSGSELPDSVTDIECHGAFWMDHHFSIKFNASDSDIEQILDAGYEATEWSEVKGIFQASTYLDDFEGRWLPANIENKSCYSLSTESKDYDQEHFLVIDHDANLVYCVSSGRVKNPDDSK